LIIEQQAEVPDMLQTHTPTVYSES